MNITEVLVGLVLLVGLAGIVVPVLPGSMLILGAILVWATVDGSGTAWVVFALTTLLLVIGAIAKYTIPGRNLKSNGVPNRSIMLGGLLGVIGFFVLPVVGLFVGFVIGVYLAEYHRVGGDQAWPTTKVTLKNVGISILIELAVALVACATWLAGAIAT